MKIIVVGLPLFAKKLISDLNEYSQKKEYIFLDTYYSKWAQLKFLLFLPFVDGVFSMNGVSDNSGTLNWVLFFKKKLWLQWVGTDTLLATKRFNEKTILRKYIDYAHTKNVTDAPWLQAELKTAEIQAELNNYKYLPQQLDAPENYSKIAVLTYIAQKRQEFYGMKQLIDLAIQNPEIDFHIIGTHTSDFDAPKNVVCHGWVAENVTFEMMQKYPIFLRLTEHDGFSLSVVEAFSLGCEVVSSNAFPYANHATHSNYREVFKQAVENVEKRGLKPNMEAMNFYRKKYDKANVMKQLHNELKEYFGK